MAIALSRTEVPLELEDGLSDRLFTRGLRLEYRFYYTANPPRIPVIRDGQLKIVRWGNGRKHSVRLPHTGWTYLADCQQGQWVGAEEVIIPATFCMENGFW